VRTLSAEGEAATAERLATHIGLTAPDAEPTAEEIEDVLDGLIIAGAVRRWRVFATARQVPIASDWITAYVPG
jgi:hypothetical protein